MTAKTSSLIPQVLQKLEEEIRSNFANVEEVDNYFDKKLASCNYLRACIDETMRMSPPVTGTVPPEVLPGGITVDGEYIPAGTLVGTGFYSIHHNPNTSPTPSPTSQSTGSLAWLGN